MPPPPAAPNANPTNFAFLHADWPLLYPEGHKAEQLVYTDPLTVCFYARRTLESALHWLYRAEPLLTLSYQDNLSALIHEPTRHSPCGTPAISRNCRISFDDALCVHGDL